ncbi:MAG: hypothetical protein ACRD3E_14845 [Terriglobales bacterium]
MIHASFKRVSAVAALAIGLCVAGFAAKTYTPPKAYDAKTYPARDDHPNEKVTIAADPYDMPDKAEAVFNLDYRDRGMLPVFLIVTNNGDQPISLTDMTVQLVTANKSKISPASRDDLMRRFSRVKRRGDEPSKLPIPFPRKSADAGVPKNARAEIDEAPFMAKAVEPHTTQAGFVFFDVDGISQPLAGAHLYVLNVHDASGQDLMYFDIPMEKYLSYRP